MHPPRASRLLARPPRHVALDLHHHAGDLVAERDLPSRDAGAGGAVGARHFGLLDAGRGAVDGVGFLAFEALH